MSNLEEALSSLVQLKRITKGSVGGVSSRWAIFCNFLEKKAILMPLNHTSHMSRAI